MLKSAWGNLRNAKLRNFRTITGSVALIAALLASLPLANAQVLGSQSIITQSTAGSNSVVLASGVAWTATADNSWLHLSAGSASGSAGQNVLFTHDAFSGSGTRNGTITFSFSNSVTLKLYVTQVAANYVPVANDPTIVSSGLNAPENMALDSSGNLFITSNAGGAVSKWTASTGVLSTIGSGLTSPTGIVVDPLGNIYWGGQGGNRLVVKAASNGVVSTLLSSGLSGSQGLAISPRSGNIFIADTGDNVIKVYNPHNSAFNTVVSSGLTSPTGVALDAADNIYIADASGIHKYNQNTSTLSTLVTVSNTYGVAVDGRGNVWYTTPTGFWLWRPSTNSTVEVGLGFTALKGVAVDGNFRVYVEDSTNNYVVQYNDGFETVAGTSQVVGAAAGTGAAVVGFLPVSPYMGWSASTVASWLHPTASGTGGGNATYTYDANTSPLPRTGTISFSSGLNVTVTQAGGSYVPVAPHTLLSLGLLDPLYTAADSSGNIYFTAATGIIGEWTASTGTATTLLTGLNSPTGIALDAAGNIYFAESGGNDIKEWTAPSGPVTTLVNGLSAPEGLAVDAAGNLYFADSGNAIKEWNAATHSLTTLVSGLNTPQGVAVDAASNVYFDDRGSDLAVKVWNPSTNAVKTLVSGLTGPSGIAVDGEGNVYYSDDRQIWELAVSATTPVSIATGANPVGVSLDTAGNVYFADNAVGFLWEIAPGFAALSSATQTVGPGDGTGSVELSILSNNAALPWTASTSSSGLTVTTRNGTGSGLVQYSYTSNATTSVATGTIIIINALALTVNRAPVNFAAPTSPITLVPASAGLFAPSGIAVDSSGNVYIADSANNAIKKWTPSNGQLTTLPIAGLNVPKALAVDQAGNLYIVDGGEGVAIREWNSSTQQLTALITAGLTLPTALAVDGSGNVYIADVGAGKVFEWSPVTQLLTTLTSSSFAITGVALDAAGRVYFSIGGHTVSVIGAGGAGTAVASGLANIASIALDAAGNIYVGGGSTIEEWNASTGTVTTLVSGLGTVGAVAVDSAGNVYYTDATNNTVGMLAAGRFIYGLNLQVSSAAGSMTLPPSPYPSAVIPATTPLSGPFAPTSDQSWLTIGTVSNGSVGLSFTANPTLGTRIAHINILGATITVQQSAATQALGAYAQTVGPAASASSIVLGFNPYTATTAWTAASNASWLTIPNSSTSGAGGGNIIFNFTQNTFPAARIGTVTVTTAAGNLTLTVTQAGSNYVPVAPVSTLASGLKGPLFAAVDGAGNVWFSENDPSLQERAASTGTITSAFTLGVSPVGVAIDAAGNIYYTDANGNAVYESHAGGGVTPLVTSGLSSPYGIAVDSGGNLYFADKGNGAVKEWSASSHAVTSLVTGLSAPVGVAVDNAGNVYYTDSSTVSIWNPSTGNATALPIPGLTQPAGVAVDAAGNVYVADLSGKAVRVWSPSTGVTTTLATGGFFLDVAPDLAGNVYFTDNVGNALSKVNVGLETLGTTTENVGPDAGASSVVVGFLPTNSTAPWTATSNASWITVTTASGAGGGLIKFTYTANTTSAIRTGTISVSGGLTLTVNQAPAGYVAVTPSSAQSIITTGLSTPEGTAVDGAGNVYFADATDNTIRVWNPSTQIVSVLVPATAGLSVPSGVTVDRAGNVYIADYANNAIKWIPAGGTLATLVPASAGLNFPLTAAADNAGNVYIADTGNNAVKEWVASTGLVIPLVTSGLSGPAGVAPDAAGNVYIADNGNNLIKVWNPSTQAVTTLFSAANNSDVEVDGAGNLFVAYGALTEWNASSQALTTVASPIGPVVSALDAAGNIYVVNGGNSAAKLTVAYASSAAITESAAAGSDTLPPVFPASTSLNGIFAPASDSAWLAIGTTANGAVSYSFTTNTTGAARTAHINILGVSIAVTQPSLNVITFNSIPTQILASGSLTLTAIASSGQPVQYTSNSATVCTVSGPTVSFVLAGVCSITASQPAAGAFGAAVPVTVTFTIDPAFSDVIGSGPGANENATFFAAIDDMLANGITSGCTATPFDYCPGLNVTRGQMAVFIIRSIYHSNNFPYSTTPYFTDAVASPATNLDGSPNPNYVGSFFPYIQKMKELGITSGCAKNTYCPNLNVTRGQMAVFIIRARYGTTYAASSLTPPTTPLFNDAVASPATNQDGSPNPNYVGSFFPFIQQMKLDGVTSGCNATSYCPNTNVTRDQMALFVMRGSFNLFLPAGAPVLSAVSPAESAAGANATITVTGQNTHFGEGTTVNAGGGVTVAGFTVINATTLTATLSIPVNATPGPISIVAITGAEQAVAPNAFTITSDPGTGAIADWQGNGSAVNSISTSSGTLQNGATYAASTRTLGLPDAQAFSLDGVNSYVQASSAETATVSGARSLVAWVNPNPTSASGQPILTGGATYAGGDIFGIAGSGGTCNIAGSYFLYVDHGGTCFVSNIAVTPGVWSLVAVTFDGSKAVFYVNGAMSVAVAATMGNYGLSTYEIGGNTLNPTTTGASFSGQLSEVQVYNRALSPAEIAGIY